MKSVNLYKIALLSILCFPLSNVYSRSCQDFQATLTIHNRTNYHIICFFNKEKTQGIRTRFNTHVPFIIDPNKSGSVTHGFMIASMGTQAGTPHVIYNCVNLKDPENGYTFDVEFSAWFTGGLAYACSFRNRAQTMHFKKVGEGFGGEKGYFLGVDDRVSESDAHISVGITQ